MAQQQSHCLVSQGQRPKSDGFQGGGATHCSGRAAASGRVVDWIAERTLDSAAAEGFADGISGIRSC